METAVDVHRLVRIKSYLEGVAEGEARADPGGDSRLTPREREILSLLTEGRSQHEIAKRLYISYTTVRTHVRNILPKIGASSIQGAVAAHLLGR